MSEPSVRFKLEPVFLDAANASGDAVLLLDYDNNQFVECNDAAVRMLNAPDKQAVLLFHPWQLSPERQPDGRLSRDKSQEMNSLAMQHKFHRFEWQHLRASGEPFPVEVTLTPVPHNGHTFLHVVWRDLSLQKQEEAREARHHRAIRMLSTINRTLTRAGEESLLLEEMCRVAIEVGGYRLAWVGYKEMDERQSVKVQAQAGFGDNYLESVFISWGDNPYGHGPAGNAIRLGETQVVQDFQHNQTVSPWRHEAAKRNLRASITLPLKENGVAFGALTIYSAHVDAFDPDEVRILEEMAEDLSFGILALRTAEARRQAEQGQEMAYSLLQAAIESTADGILVSGLDGEIKLFNRKFARMFGVSDDAERGRQVVDVLAHLAQDGRSFVKMLRDIQHDLWQEYDHVFTLKDGRTIERITRPQLLNGELVGRVCSFRDISMQLRHEQQLLHNATHDALTGLPNLSLLTDRIQHALARAAHGRELLAVIFMDLDRFKLVNDTMGHDTGDKLLRLVAARLPACLRPEDTLARLGGDDFVILLENLAHEEDAALAAQALAQAVAIPTEVDGREFFPTASLGIALFPRDGEEPAELIRHADAAMYRAKARGGHSFQFYTPEFQEHSLRKLDLTTQLRRALQRNEISVHFQPMYDLSQGRITGAEALLRWRHPTLGSISPVEFIPLAEETGLINDLCAWTVHAVCTQLDGWQMAGLPQLRISLNLSARQFDSEDLAAGLPALLSRCEAHACNLELEITEGVLFQNPERAEKILRTLNARGYTISLDDFGTGYSSLSYLTRFPVQKLKIDRSFITHLPEHRDSAAITGAVIAMARQLGILVVAEGVETAAQLEFLRQHQCDLVQGFLTGKPMPALEFETLLREMGLS